MIAACTETSSADVISSQISTEGSQARARATATRWRSPPESSSGYAAAIAPGKRYALQGVVHPLVRRATAKAEEVFDGEADDLADRAARIQGVVRTLEDVLEAAPTPGRPLADAGAQHVACVDDLAATRDVQTHDDARQRRFPGARLADDRQALAWAELERGVVHHLMVAVERIDVADNQDRLGFHCRGVGENGGLEVLEATSATRKHATE